MSNVIETIEQKNAREKAELKAISEKLKKQIEDLQPLIDEEKDLSKKKALQCQLEFYKSIKHSADTNTRDNHRMFVDMISEKLNKFKDVGDDEDE
jgi:hypothetical protein